MHGLDDDHGIVDDQPDGDSETAQRHEVERLAQGIENQKRRAESERQGERGDERGAQVAQEDGEDEHGEERAEEDGVAHGAHAAGDELGLLVDGPQLDARRQRREQLLKPRAHGRIESEDVSGGASRDVEDDARLAVDADEGGARLDPFDHAADVAGAHRGLRRAAHHDAGDIVGGEQLAGDDAQRLVVRIGEPRHGLHAVGGAELLGDGGNAQVRGGGADGVEQHL